METDPMFWLAVPQRPRLYLIRDPAAISADQLHALLQNSYWAKGIPLATVERALANSQCQAVMSGEQLVAFARAVTDGATFAWICDVIVHPDWRGNGLGKQVVRELLSQPELQGLRRLLLATADAHGLYQRHGFASLKAPERWLELHNASVYQTAATANSTALTQSVPAPLSELEALLSETRALSTD
jgi:N-acetylglutamate synthase-like GNAT family acetyltransferase